jgi:hypothetical protein
MKAKGYVRSTFVNIIKEWKGRNKIVKEGENGT